MTYEELLKYLETLVPRDFRMELGPMTEACHLVGEPQYGYPTVHVSGTNGKGSTAAFLATILQESGYRVGLMTSPHLSDVRERIRVNGEAIAQEELRAVAFELRQSLPNDRFLSFFEFMTLAGFVHFREQKVDVAVIETGLGGRLDATNVVDPKVTVITSISIDHREHLGNTLKDIAAEKCGIVKRGVPTVTARQPDEAMLEVRRWCDDVGSPLIVADPEEITTTLGLAGEHQKQNAACAVEAARVLSDSGMHIDRINEALTRTRWPGRLETLAVKPAIIVDGAHNPAGAETLARYVSASIPRERAVLMLGVLKGKDMAGICRQLVPLFREVICVKAPSHRAASPKDLAAIARAYGSNVRTVEDITQAFNECRAVLKPDDTLIVSGSFTVVGAVRELVADMLR